MVYVKVRETYDLNTIKQKMSVIAIHTPKPDIIKKNFPGLLMQCRAYRPVSADVRIACASVLPVDPQGVGLAEGDVAPEDMFNPILYKAMSNKGMSQLEARINHLTHEPQIGDIEGAGAMVMREDVTNREDEFGVYYGLLSNAHDWKKANPQAGLEMRGLRPYVYEMNYALGDQAMGLGEIEPLINEYGQPENASPSQAGVRSVNPIRGILGKAKPFPFLPCVQYSYQESKEGEKASSGFAKPGFPISPNIDNCSVEVPWLNVVCGAIIVPPSRLHQLFYRMVVEWTIEFSTIRPLGDLTDWAGLNRIGDSTHFQSYSYEAAKEAITGDPKSELVNDTCMVSTNTEIKKVM